MKLTTQRKLGFILMNVSIIIWLVGMLSPASIITCFENQTAMYWAISYLVLGLVGIFIHSEANRKLGQRKFW